MNALTLFLVIYFALFLGLAFALRSWQTWRRTGINPYKLTERPGAEYVVTRYFRVMPFLSLAALVFYAAGAAHYTLLAPITWLELPVLRVVGLVLMTVALVWVVIAQAQMGESWRIGVDYDSHGPMVRRGLFKYSRNPIFVGILVSVLGFFLVLPNALTLVTLLLDLVLIQVQVSVEEVFLEEAYGEDYNRYRREVRRWI
ncbi:MAG: DUF1295 domain-containing protein [Halioglobus sp.]|nr:DUF1295 domain-containing protein [Halioglobus sp.]